MDGDEEEESESELSIELIDECGEEKVGSQVTNGSTGIGGVDLPEREEVEDSTVGIGRNWSWPETQSINGL